jgi:hypothetical protein
LHAPVNVVVMVVPVVVFLGMVLLHLDLAWLENEAASVVSWSRRHSAIRHSSRRVSRAPGPMSTASPSKNVVNPRLAVEQALRHARDVTIYFVALEPDAQEFYAKELADFDLVAVPNLQEVDHDAEVVSVFVDEQIDDGFLAQHPNMKLIATRSRSTDHIDLAACRARGVAVSNVPHYGEQSVAEHTFALLLALVRRLRELMAQPKDGQFSYSSTRCMELAGKDHRIDRPGPLLGSGLHCWPVPSAWKSSRTTSNARRISQQGSASSGFRSMICSRVPTSSRSTLCSCLRLIM